MRSSAIREELGVEPLLLHIERSQLRWFGPLVRIPASGGYLDMTNWEEAPLGGPEQMRGIISLSWPDISPKGAGRGGQGEGELDFSAQAAAPMRGTWISGR